MASTIRYSGASFCFFLRPRALSARRVPCWTSRTSRSDIVVFRVGRPAPAEAIIMAPILSSLVRQHIVKLCVSFNSQTGVALPIELCGVRKIHYAPAQTAGRRPLTLKIYEARRHDGTRTRSLNLNVHFFYVPGDLFMKWVMAADRVSGAAPVLRQARRQPPREEEDMRYTVISCCAPSPKAC